MFVVRTTPVMPLDTSVNTRARQGSVSDVPCHSQEPKQTSRCSRVGSSAQNCAHHDERRRRNQRNFSADAVTYQPDRDLTQYSTCQTLNIQVAVGQNI